MTKKNKSELSVLLGAAFLMATSAIGPGFLTQTATFTEQFQANFGFAIFICIVMALIVQLNVWRVIGITGLRAQDIANKVFPGLGYLIAFLVALGGLVFNIGNVGGAGLGLNVLFGLDIRVATAIGGISGMLLFASKNAKSIMDRVTNILGILMIVVTTVSAVASNPPVGVAIQKTLMPENINALLFPILTLLGGTVGGYIVFSGGHRLVDAGITGKENIKDIDKSASTGILVSSIMRVIFFLLVLGVVSKGIALESTNPAASAFQNAAGNVGYKFFGVVLFSASVSSVIGAAYTSVSFLKTFSKVIEENENKFIIGFIALSTVIMVFIGQPASLLVLAGSLNGLILPITLGTMLIASVKKEIVGDYQHPKLLLILGIIIVIATAYTGFLSLQNITKLF
ncbi:MAG: divalent metal cation transporter [Tissierellia bacterium]|nr:divalent metal cation transporter [Tissierellia bacterium]